MARLYGNDKVAPGKKRLQPLDVKRRMVDWVMNGGTMRAFCRRPGYPCVKTIYLWLRKDLQFAEDLREAKVLGYDMMAQKCIDIADEKGLLPEDVNRAKLRIETRLKLLARWDTARYGDKILHGSDPDNPIQTMSDADVMAEVMGLLATAKARQLADVGNRLTDDSLN